MGRTEKSVVYGAFENEGCERLSERTETALDALAENKTTIVISHRYKALLNTDKILVLHEGEQVGYDHLDKLMAENKYFADMFAGQKEVTV